MRKFPFVKQHDAMQCGIASLAMICEYFGKKYSIDFYLIIALQQLRESLY